MNYTDYTDQVNPGNMLKEAKGLKHHMSCVNKYIHCINRYLRNKETLKLIYDNPNGRLRIRNQINKSYKYRNFNVSCLTFINLQSSRCLSFTNFTHVNSAVRQRQALYMKYLNSAIFVHYFNSKNIITALSGNVPGICMYVCLCLDCSRAKTVRLETQDQGWQKHS